jgi:hypothetical protein
MNRLLVVAISAGTGQRRASSIFIDSLHEYAASGYGLFPFVPPAGRSTFGRLASPGAPGFIVMPSPTRSYISAVTLLLQCTSGNAMLAQRP